ncbi:MAG: hypothetical protein IKS46_05810 [Clostridia bacterium]|nr:hypothetical protein [Clostridia bacterium]
MKDLYSEKDLLEISGQLKKRYLLLGCGLAVLLALVIWSMIIRAEWFTMVSLFLFCAVAVFVIDMFCLPLHRYKKLIRAALTGRSHTETLEYKEAESETSVVDGVTCVGLIFLGTPDKHGTREQRFYWDKELPLPAFSAGDQVTLKYTGRNIIGYEI